MLHPACKLLRLFDWILNKDVFPVLEIILEWCCHYCKYVRYWAVRRGRRTSALLLEEKPMTQNIESTGSSPVFQKAASSDDSIVKIPLDRVLAAPPNVFWWALATFTKRTTLSALIVAVITLTVLPTNFPEIFISRPCCVLSAAVFTSLTTIQ